MSAALDMPAQDADAEAKRIAAERVQQKRDEVEIKERFASDFAEKLERCHATIRGDSSDDLFMRWKEAGEAGDRLRRQIQRISNLPHVWARQDREASEAAARAAEKAAALREAMTGPPEPPAGSTEQALELHAIAMAAYAGDLKGQTGELLIARARRCGWEAALAHYRRHERPSVGRAQAEDRLHAMGLGAWAQWG